jgi:hypothetical protein
MRGNIAIYFQASQALSEFFAQNGYLDRFGDIKQQFIYACLGDTSMLINGDIKGDGDRFCVMGLLGIRQSCFAPLG